MHCDIAGLSPHAVGTRGSGCTCHAMLLTVCCYVEVSLIQTPRLKVRVEVPENGSCGLAGCGVLLEVGFDKDQLRAEPACDEAGHSSTDAKLAGVVVGGAYHSNAAHCHRFGLLHGQQVL